MPMNKGFRYFVNGHRGVKREHQRAKWKNKNKIKDDKWQSRINDFFVLNLCADQYEELFSV